MPRKNKNKTPKNTQNRRSRRPRRRRNRTPGALSTILPSRYRIQEFKNYLLDPCRVPPPMGVFGSIDGSVLTFRATYANTTNQPAGLFIVIPTFSPNPSHEYKHDDAVGDGNVRSANMFFFSGASNTTPSSTGMGMTGGFGAPSTTWKSTQDPCSRYLADGDSGQFGEAQLLGGCLKMHYTGALNHASGEYCIMETDLAALVDFRVGVSVLPSVDSIFNAAPYSARIGVDVAEIKFRPSPHPVSPADGYMLQADGTGNGLYAQGNSGATLNPPAYLVAWRGLTPLNTSAGLTITYTKSCNMRSRVHSSAIAGAVVTSPPHNIGPPVDKVALEELDRDIPGWDFAGMIDAATTYANAAFGAGRAVSRALSTPLGHALRSGVSRQRLRMEL